MQNRDEAVRPPGQVGDAAAGEFEMNNRRVITCLVIACALFLVGIFFLVAGLLYDFPEPVLNKRVLIGLVGVVSMVFALILFFSNLQKYGQRVVLFPEGFRLIRGVKPTVVAWGDIDTVWRHSSTIGGSRELTETNLWLEVKGGNVVYLSSFFLHMDKLAEIILGETERRLVPEKWSLLQQGEAVQFGKLKVSATKLFCGDRELAWRDVNDIVIAHGGIEIQQRDGRCWFYSPIKQLPNYHIFLALANKQLQHESNDR